MATLDDGFASLIASVVSNFDEINSFIQTTDFILKKYGEKPPIHGYSAYSPFKFLREWRGTEFWDEYFSYIMQQWDDDKMMWYASKFSH